MIYLDHAASTPLWPRALEVLQSTQKEFFANPSSAHKLGKEQSRLVENCRQKFHQFLGREEDGKIIFTASATESNNLLIRGLPLKPHQKVFVSSADHPSLIAPLKGFEDFGHKVEEIPLNSEGLVDMEALENGLDREVGLFMISHVSSQTGCIQDIQKIREVIDKKSPQCHFHLDGSQSFAKISIPKVYDSLSLSSHKIGGPKGTACLYVKEGVELTPLLFGGGQEKGLRASTLCYPLIEAFTTAAEISTERASQNREELAVIKSFLRDELGKSSRIIFPYSEESTSPYILMFLLEGISSDIILRHLEEKEVYLSSSSACSSKIKGENPAFSALGFPKEKHKFVLRLSLGTASTMEEAKEFIGVWNALLEDIGYLFKE